MSEYIDLDDKIVVTDIRGRERETTVRNILDSNNGTYHAADVRPVCRGKWKKANGSYCCGITEDGDSITLPTVRCSVCKKLIAPIIWKNFCPNCGADMREES